MDFRESQAQYSKDLRAVTMEKLVQGALVRAVLSMKEGLKFKDGRTEKPKRIVIIGVDRSNNLCFGTILINTKQNPRSYYSDEFFVTQYCLRKEDYPDFLDYDSYVDCSNLFAIPFSVLARGEYFGVLNATDKSEIINILETTETIETSVKKRFGIRRR